jgi:hypothetical protein
MHLSRVLGDEPIGGPAQQGADCQYVADQLVMARHSGTEDRNRDARYCEQDPKDVPSPHPFTEQTTRSDEHEHGLKGTYHRRIDDAGEFDGAEEHGHIASQKNATEP